MKSEHQLAVRFGWVSLFQDLGSKMVIPLLPLFLSLSLGASPLMVGVIEAAGIATAAGFAVAIGHFAPDRPLLPLVRLGYGLSSVAKLALAFTTGWGQVLLVRVADRAGKGIRDTPRDLMLAATPAANRGRVFGIQQALDKTGGFLGPLVGLLVFWLANESFETVFALAFVPCALGTALLWGKRAPAEPDNQTQPKASSPRVNVTRSQQWALVLLGAHGLAFVPTSLLLLRASAIGMGVNSILMAYALQRFVTAVVSYPAGALSDRFRGPMVVSAGAVVTALALAISATAISTWTMVAGLGLIGAADALTRAPVKSWLLSLGPSGTRGSVLGNRSGIVSIATLLSGIIAGAAWGESGQLPMLGAALLALTVGIAIWTIPTPTLGQQTTTASH